MTSAGSVAPCSRQTAIISLRTASLVSSPPAQDIPAQSTRTCQWTFQTTSAGSLSFAINASGTDKLSGAPLSASANAGPALLQTPAALLASIAASPSTANSGQAIAVSLTVKNQGQASAQAVVPALSVGGAGATLVSGPTPGSAAIAGGSWQVFTWAYQGAAVGIATFSATASGTDANNGQAVSASTATPASVAVQSPAALAAAFTVSAQSVNVGQAFTATLVVSNSGDSAAGAVTPATPTLAGSGGATLTGVTPASATIPGHGSQGFVFTYAGSARGTVALSGTASGTDAIDGKQVSSAPATSPTVIVQTPPALSAALAIPKNLPLGDSFTAALTVTNSGDAAVNALSPGVPTIGPASTGAATLVSGPSPATPVTLPGHSDQTFSWVYTASGEGTLQLSAQAAGTDANDGTSRAASASSAVVPIAEAVQVATNPFGNGSSFSFLLSFSGQLWLGPDATGTGAVRMNADGSGAQAVPWQLEHPSGAKNTAYQGVPAHTVGYKGCGANTAGCGPDNESGRGLFFTGVVAGTEWLGLAGAHANAGTDYARFVYLTNGGFPLATGGYTDFAYADLSSAVSSSTNSLTAAAIYHDRLYLGFQDSNAPLLEAVTTMPSLPGSAPNANDMGATNMPGIGGGLDSRIDSMAVFGSSPNDSLYLANANGFTRSTSTTPGQCQIVIVVLLCPDWTDATPSALAYTLKSSVTTSKISDLEPADRAVPAMVGFGGRLFAARNTTTGPQLWSCDPTQGGSSSQCDPGDWSLLAPNTVGDARLSQFNDAGNAAVTLLAATPQHLYVGFNNATRGVVVYRTANAAAATAADFSGRLGCAATGSSCPGIGGDGLGAALTRIYDGRALSFAGNDYLYLAAGTATSPVQIYRVLR